MDLHLKYNYFISNGFACIVIKMSCNVIIFFLITVVRNWRNNKYLKFYFSALDGVIKDTIMILKTVVHFEI